MYFNISVHICSSKGYIINGYVVSIPLEVYYLRCKKCVIVCSATNHKRCNNYALCSFLFILTDLKPEDKMSTEFISDVLTVKGFTVGGIFLFLMFLLYLLRY